MTNPALDEKPKTADVSRIMAPQLQGFAKRALAAAGLRDGDAEIVASLMVEADLRGSDAHGVIRLPVNVKRLKAGGNNPRPNIRIVQEKPATALVTTYQNSEPQGKTSRMSLDQLFQRMQSGTAKELNLILKADVQGSVEVLGDTMRKLSTSEVKVSVIHSAVGAISTNDILLASASDAIVVGFNVRPERSAGELAEKEGIDVRLYTVIYNLVDEMKLAMTGLLDPKFQEVFQGRAEVRSTFKVPKAGVIAGCMVTEGVIPRAASVRLLRDNRVILEGKIASLRHFKNDVAEVRQGFECGIGLGYNDVRIGHTIETYEMREKPRD